MKHTLRFFIPVLLAGVLAIPACSNNNPNTPSVTFTAPIAAGPAGSTTFKFKAQPITLTITNAVRTGSAVATYNLEVATDAGFANKVVNQTGIAEGSGSTTSVPLSTLQGGTYYWRWHTVIDGVVGQASATQSFVVTPQIVINAPALLSPASGTSTGQSRPTFTITNATRTGPVGTIFYLFQVSTSASFATITMSANVQEQQNSPTTSWTPTADLAVGSFFWRVQASDPLNTESSTFTNAVSFVRANAFLDMKQAVIINTSSDIANWPEAATVTSIDTSGSRIILDHTARDGPGAWPDVPFGDGTLQYTLGMCLNISNQWYCSAVVQFWRDRDLAAGGDVNEVGINWFYDRWGPMDGYQPSQGETVGMFAVAGNQRDAANQFIAQERTNVVLFPWGGTYTAPGAATTSAKKIVR